MQNMISNNKVVSPQEVGKAFLSWFSNAFHVQVVFYPEFIYIKIFLHRIIPASMTSFLQ